MAEEIGNRLPAVLYNHYFMLGKYDKAMDYLEILFNNNNKNPGWPYLSAKPIYDKMKDTPRYIAILEELNLPVAEE